MSWSRLQVTIFLQVEFMEQGQELESVHPAETRALFFRSAANGEVTPVKFDLRDMRIYKSLNL